MMEGPSKTNPLRWTGRSRDNRLVHVAADGFAPGEVIDVVITRALKHSLEADPIDPPTPNPAQEDSLCLSK